jgi:hypothetical protein
MINQESLILLLRKDLKLTSYSLDKIEESEITIEADKSILFVSHLYIGNHICIGIEIFIPCRNNSNLVTYIQNSGETMPEQKYYDQACCLSAQICHQIVDILNKENHNTSFSKESNLNIIK